MNRFLNAATLTTVIRYGLQALGGILVANGKMDPGQWETISGAALVVLPMLLGVLSANSDKVVVSGKTVPVKELPPSTKEVLKTSVSNAPKATVLEHLVGIFGKKLGR